MNTNALPRIMYGETQTITESVQDYMTYKGYVRIEVMLPDGGRYEIECIDTVRLGQTMESHRLYDEPVLIVMDEITVESVAGAINGLYAEGFFEGLLPQRFRSPRYGGIPSAIRFVGQPIVTISQIARAYMTDKGWVRAQVTLPNSNEYKMQLFTPLRLRQDIESLKASTGRFYIAHAGMIVVEEVTDESVEHAITQWYELGFFEYLVPTNP